MTFFSRLADADPKQAHVAAQWPHDAPLINCRFDPTGRYVFATAEDTAVVRWELATGTKVACLGHESWPRGIAFSADGQTVVTSGSDDTLIWWPATADKPEPIRKVTAHKGWIRALASSPDGTLLASGGNDHLVKLWNLADGSLVAELAGHEKHVYSALFHPSGPWLLTGDLAGQVKQWEIPSGKLLRTFDAKPLYSFNAGQGVDYGGVRGLSVSPEGKYLACSGLHNASNPLGAVSEPLVLRFDWETAALLKSHITKGINGTAWRAVFHPASFLIGLSGGSGGGFLLFWNADDEAEFHRFQLPNLAREMDLHRDGLQVATAHHDRHVRITRLAAPEAKT